MNKIILMVVLSLSILSCNPTSKEIRQAQDTNVAVLKADTTEEQSFYELLQSKSKIKGLQEFDLVKLNLNEDNVNKNNFERVDSVFYTKHLYGNGEFPNKFDIDNKKHDYFYRHIYFYSFLENKPCNCIFLIDDCYDGSNSYKLLSVNFDDKGNVLSTFLLALTKSYPGAHEEYGSKLINDTIIRYKKLSDAQNYIEEENRYYNIIDSITTKYTINDNGLFELLNYYDSIRYDTR